MTKQWWKGKSIEKNPEQFHKQLLNHNATMGIDWIVE